MISGNRNTDILIALFLVGRGGRARGGETVNTKLVLRPPPRELGTLLLC